MDELSDSNNGIDAIRASIEDVTSRLEGMASEENEYLISSYLKLQTSTSNEAAAVYRYLTECYRLLDESVRIRKNTAGSPVAEKKLVDDLIDLIRTNFSEYDRSRLETKNHLYELGLAIEKSIKDHDATSN